MKYGTIFSILGLFLLLSVFQDHSPSTKLIATYVALNFVSLGLAYFFGFPGLWLKDRNGRVSPVSYTLLAPLHLLNWFSLLLAVRLQSEPPACEVAPRIWLGRRLVGRDTDVLHGLSSLAVLDLTAEFEENRALAKVAYLCIPVLDHTAPTRDQLMRCVEFIQHHSSLGAVFVHCALGHGRSATAIAAWLLKTGRYSKVEEVESYLREIRSGVSLERSQRLALKGFQLNQS